MPKAAEHRSSATQQIAGWLEKLGMSEYAQRFAENDIDVSVLRQLTDHDFERLGVSLGHRRKLAAITSSRRNPINRHCRASTSGAELLEAPSAASHGDVLRPRRSTALSARMDPEDLREVISAYQKCVADTVQRFGGFVAKYMGDGVLVYFGYPQAHEDDAERAVRAGLELIVAVAAAQVQLLRCKPVSALLRGWS